MDDVKNTETTLPGIDIEKQKAVLEDGQASQIGNGGLPQAPLPHNSETNQKPYSSFTVRQKRGIVFAASLASFFSPMTGAIYFPALTTIANDLHVSDSGINLTVTTYLIWQGVAPMLIAGFSDKAGRRPAYILCFGIYIIANLALSLQNSYTALLVLRMLQSAGSSGTVALANGVVADVVTSAERGEYIAYASLGSVLGPSLSPIIGGLIAQNLDWHWIFWFLLIFSLAFAVPFLLFLPETGRKVVGDGSIPPPWPNANLTDWLRHRHQEDVGITAEKIAEIRKDYKFSFPNPLPTFKVLLDPESILLLLATGMALACFYAISTGASASFKDTYNFNDIQVALMFLPIGAGGIISAFTTGKLVDWNFRRWCRKKGVVADKRILQDIEDFPIELARIEIGLPIYVVGVLAVLGYGWMLQASSPSHQVSLAGPVIILLLLGWALIACFQCLNALMVDIWPGKAASATAANNLVRCGLGAGASAAIEPMGKAMGRGWAYTVLAALSLVFGVGGLVLCTVYGQKLREGRTKRENKAKGGKEPEKQRAS